jgi:hypothetical protein
MRSVGVWERLGVCNPCSAARKQLLPAVSGQTHCADRFRGLSQAVKLAMLGAARVPSLSYKLFTRRIR